MGQAFKFMNNSRNCVFSDCWTKMAPEVDLMSFSGGPTKTDRSRTIDKVVIPVSSNSQARSETCKQPAQSSIYHAFPCRWPRGQDARRAIRKGALDASIDCVPAGGEHINAPPGVV